MLFIFTIAFATATNVPVDVFYILSIGLSSLSLIPSPKRDIIFWVKQSIWLLQFWELSDAYSFVKIVVGHFFTGFYLTAESAGVQLYLWDWFEHSWWYLSDLWYLLLTDWLCKSCFLFPLPLCLPPTSLWSRLTEWTWKLVQRVRSIFIV